MDGKPIICIDFDGVIHSYERGWQGGEIYGHVTPGFFEWATAAKEHFALVIYSSRSKTPEGREMMYFWLKNQWGSWAAGIAGGLLDDHIRYGDFEFTDVKPPAFLTIDDRAICFMGDWVALDPAQLTQFKPWTMFDRSGASDFVAEWDRMVATISNFASRYDLPKPQMVFHPAWLHHMNKISDARLGPTIIYMDVKIRFGMFEQVDALRLG